MIPVRCVLNKGKKPDVLRKKDLLGRQRGEDRGEERTTDLEPIRQEKEGMRRGDATST